ncbi:ubiquitin-like domain-containing protein [Metabacillus sp. RGM 3146]|uniref:ubiquitin-like domain-containing protein n=1 Tax=Metabacillus sp. RGM 3146 TaxID=3401092 RepID=UPI003B9AC939
MKKLFSERMNKNKIILSAASLLVLGTGTAFGTYEGSKQDVSVDINGKQEKIRTHAETVGNLLRELNIDPDSHDKLSHPENTRIKSNMKIVFQDAKPVTVTSGGKTSTVMTTARTVGDVLKEEHIKLSKFDKVSPSLETKIGKDTALTIDRAFQLTLNNGGKKEQVWTTSTTVADFLKDRNIKLNDHDQVEPGMDHTLRKNETVSVLRVEKVTDVVEEPLRFAVVTKNDSNLDRGEQKVVEPGEKGKQTKNFLVVRKNGKEVGRKLISISTLQESSDRVVAIGTKAPPAPKATPVASKSDSKPRNVSRGNQSVSKEMYVNSTAYTASCSGCSGKTATGVNLKANPNAKVIAVDPDVIPLGTKVYVEGYGYAVAADTGSAINGHKIDVFFPDNSSAYKWGNKRVKIKILN